MQAVDKHTDSVTSVTCRNQRRWQSDQLVSLSPLVDCMTRSGSCCGVRCTALFLLLLLLLPPALYSSVLVL